MKSLTKIFIIFFFSIFSFSQNDNNYERYGELFETSEIIKYKMDIRYETQIFWGGKIKGNEEFRDIIKNKARR